jgi:hypothetical protein
MNGMPTGKTAELSLKTVFGLRDVVERGFGAVFNREQDRARLLSRALPKIVHARHSGKEVRRGGNA